MKKKYMLLIGVICCLLGLAGCQVENQTDLAISQSAQEVMADAQTQETEETLREEVPQEAEEEAAYEEEPQDMAASTHLSDNQESPEEIPVEVMWIDNPALEKMSLGNLTEPKAKPVTLTKLSEEENKIIDEEEWLADNGFTIERHGNTPGYSFFLHENYNPETFTGYALEVYDLSTQKVAYRVDLSAFYDVRAFFSLEEETEAWYPEYRFAYLEDSILYVSMAHRTYAESMPYTAFIIAIDLESESLLWKSDNLVSNANSFVVLDEVILCGYGFTDEADYLYQLDKNSGEVVGEPIKLRTGPDYLFYRDEQLYVRTYNTNYVFAVEGTNKTTQNAQMQSPVEGTIKKDGVYTTKDEVALYLHTYGCLPSNYMTKKEARELGFPDEGTMDEVAPGKSIGGDVFGNREGLLPKAKNRIYYECDIDYTSGKRNAKRIVYSNDGLIYYTKDHYASFEEMHFE